MFFFSRFSLVRRRFYLRSALFSLGHLFVVGLLFQLDSAPASACGGSKPKVADSGTTLEAPTEFDFIPRRLPAASSPTGMSPIGTSPTNTSPTMTSVTQWENLGETQGAAGWATGWDRSPTLRGSGSRVVDGSDDESEQVTIHPVRQQTQVPARKGRPSVRSDLWPMPGTLERARKQSEETEEPAGRQVSYTVNLSGQMNASDSNPYTPTRQEIAEKVQAEVSSLYPDGGNEQVIHGERVRRGTLHIILTANLESVEMLAQTLQDDRAFILIGVLGYGPEHRGVVRSLQRLGVQHPNQVEVVPFENVAEVPAIAKTLVHHVQDHLKD